MANFVRSTASKYKFGAHISGAGGISKSVINAHNIGCNSFAMFLKSPRKWISPPYTQEEIDKFHENCKTYHYDPLHDILPHGQYFINLANPDKAKAEKSYESFLDDLKRCESLGIGHYNFHPGSSLNGDHPTQLKQLADYVNRAIRETSFVKIVLENMAGTGSLVGSNLQDLHDVIQLIEDKTRVGVCVDTCHTYAAGYDISTPVALEKFWKLFDETIGYEYLSSIHLNDSKAPLAANRDLHEKLGQGYLGLHAFRWMANFDKLQGIPIILETPYSDDTGYGEEIKLLEWLENISAESEEEEAQFKEKYQSLQDLGSKSRKEQMDKFLVKQAKDKKKTTKKRTKGPDIMESLTEAKKVKTE